MKYNTNTCANQLEAKISRCVRVLLIYLTPSRYNFGDKVNSCSLFLHVVFLYVFFAWMANAAPPTPTIYVPRPDKFGGQEDIRVWYQQFELFVELSRVSDRINVMMFLETSVFQAVLTSTSATDHTLTTVRDSFLRVIQQNMSTSTAYSCSMCGTPKFTWFICYTSEFIHGFIFRPKNYWLASSLLSAPSKIASEIRLSHPYRLSMRAS